MAADPAVAGLSGKIVHDEIVPARAPWDHPVKKGETLRIVDLEGNQAVDTLFFTVAGWTSSRAIPANVIFVPGNVARGLCKKSLSLSGVQTMPEFFIAPE